MITAGFISGRYGYDMVWSCQNHYIYMYAWTLRQHNADSSRFDIRLAVMLLVKRTHGVLGYISAKCLDPERIVLPPATHLRIDFTASIL